MHACGRKGFFRPVETAEALLGRFADIANECYCRIMLRVECDVRLQRDSTNYNGHSVRNVVVNVFTGVVQFIT